MRTMGGCDMCICLYEEGRMLCDSSNNCEYIGGNDIDSCSKSDVNNSSGNKSGTIDFTSK